MFLQRIAVGHPGDVVRDHPRTVKLVLGFANRLPPVVRQDAGIVQEDLEQVAHEQRSFIAAGGSGGAVFETDPTKPGQAITAAMASLGAGTDSVAGFGLAFQSLYFLGALLFILTLLLNVLSDRIVRRFRQVY